MKIPSCSLLPTVARGNRINKWLRRSFVSRGASFVVIGTCRGTADISGKWCARENPGDSKNVGESGNGWGAEKART